MAYSLTYSYNSSSQSYSVTGYSNITASDKVVIPSTYDNGTNGEHPVTSIGDNAFRSCSSLTSITIPDSVTSIGNNAFYQCSSLKSIDIPKSVTNIRSNAFAYCSSLTSVMIPDSVTSIGNSSFASCSKLTSITIPDSVKSIEMSVFFDCSSLTNVTIGNSVTRIDSHSFYNCSKLTSITIPDSVTSIGNSAFKSCYSLKQLIMFPEIPPTLGTSAIPSRISKIYAQQSSKAAYQAATNWTTFASKIVSDNLYLSFVRFNTKNKEYINGKVGNKLTAPTTPTADSAVTMLADGTVGTKPLSEISGSGGKIYNHAIYYFISDTDLSVTINVITSSSTSFTQFSEFKSLIENKVASITGPEFCGAAAVTTTDNQVWIRGGGASGSDTTTYATIDKKLDSSSFSSDTVTEI